MPYNEDLDARISEIVTPWGATRKTMFGGTGYLLNGNMLAGVMVEPAGAEGADLLEWLLLAKEYVETLPAK